MNRRCFITNLIGASAAFSILPAATTYARKWIAPRPTKARWEINPEWVNAPYEIAYWNEGRSLIVKSSHYYPPNLPPPIRFTFDPVGGALRQVHQFIQT